MRKQTEHNCDGKMKLAEIKKCKVAELRSRLQELGLDTRGLKTELVGRLWSAVESGLRAQTEATDPHILTGGGLAAEELKPQRDSPLSSEMGVGVDAQVLRSPGAGIGSAEASPAEGVSAPRAPRPAREYTHTATQTEPGSSHAFILSVPDNVMAGLPETRSSSRSRSKQTLLESLRVSVPPAAVRGPDGVRRGAAEEQAERVTTPGADAHDDQSKGTGSRQPAGESGRAAAPEEEAAAAGGRGRAFYEFKEEVRYKRAKSPHHSLLEEEGVMEEDKEKVKIDPYACDLHFEVGPDGRCGQPRFWERFPLLWSGCKMSHGAQRGGVSFEVRLDRKLLTSKEERDPGTCGLRVGWSLQDASLLLGEDVFSYAYDSRGEKVTGGKAEEFGEGLSEGDIVGCYLLFSADGAAEMSFRKNGRPMGTAFQLSASVLRGSALFPHVLCKSCSFSFHLDPTAPPWYPGPLGFTPIVALSAVERLRAPPGPTSRAESEVVVMVGLPGSGKSHWARIHKEQHPGKRFKLLGTEALLTSMISGGQKEPEMKLQQASQCLTELIKMAAHTPGNYILDQPNVLFSARHHKLQLFRGFRQRTVVVVFPPTEEWRRRLALQQAQDGERIPETALLKLQVSCSLPEEQKEPFEELHYVELAREEAQKLLQAYREEAQSLLPPIPKREKKKPPLRRSRYLHHGPPHSHGSTYAWNGLQAWGQQPRSWSSGYPDHGYYYNNNCFGYSSYHGYW